MVIDRMSVTTSAVPRRRSFPIVATLLVLVAAGIMVVLGFWQLERLREKEALLDRYGAAHGSKIEVAWPRTPQETGLALYRHARLTCVKVVGHNAIAGRNAQDEAGIAQYAQCVLPDGSQAKVVMGWSRDPSQMGTWDGGEVRGVIAPGPRLVADPPLGGLEANATPDPSELPNNHLAYAVQWFLFAATALVVYFVALRRRVQS